MGKKRLYILLVMLPSILLLTTGCWDSKDINEKSINISIGVDYINDLIEITGEIVKLNTTTKESEGNSEASGVYTVFSYGKTYEEARINYDANLPNRSFLGATRIVILGDNFAKEIGIESYLNRIDSLYDYRKTVLIAICKGPTNKIFDVKTDKQIAIGFVADDILMNLKENGYAVSPNVGNLLSDIAFGNLGYVVPYIGEELDDIKYLGLAVCNEESKLIDVINVHDANSVLYLLSKNFRIVELISNEINDKNRYSIRLTLDKRKIKTSYKNNRAVIDINLKLNGELLYQYYIDEISDEMIKQFEQKLSEKATNDINNIINRAQKDFRCDIFRFGKIFKAQHYKQFRKINWQEEFLGAKVNVKVDTTIVNKNLKSSEEQSD
jgi:spore germination protein KC